MSYHGYSGLGTTATQQASALYDQASTAYHAGDYHTALAKFQQAYALAPNPTVLIGIGQSEKQLGLLAAAVASFQAYLKQVPTGSGALLAKAALDELQGRSAPATTPAPLPVKPPLDLTLGPGDSAVLDQAHADQQAAAAAATPTGMSLGVKVAIAAGVLAAGAGVYMFVTRKPKAVTTNRRRRAAA